MYIMDNMCLYSFYIYTYILSQINIFFFANTMFLILISKLDFEPGDKDSWICNYFQYCPIELQHWLNDSN